MTQVVTNENMMEFIENRKVPEFKAPEPAKTETPAESSDKPRGADGKFVKQESVSNESNEGVDKSEKEADKSASADVQSESKADARSEDDSDPEDADLPERVRRQIGKKHRAMKEAEEFGKKQYLERRAAEERAERLERENNELKSKSRPVQEKKEDKGAPNPEDFKTVAEYTDALTDYKLDQKLKERAALHHQEQQQKAASEATAAFSQRLAKAMEEIPDYEEVLSAAEDNDTPPHVFQYIVESEIGPALAYHLAKHSDIRERIAKLSPIRAIAELGKLETKLEKKPEPEKPVEAKPQVSKAPSPITPIEGKMTAVEKDPAKMTFKELREYERQREATKRAQR